MSLEYCIQKAREIPYTSNQQRHYAIVVDRKGKIVSQGSNSYVITHPLMHKCSKKLGLCKDYLHSEVNALIRDKYRRGVKLIVARVDSKGFPCNSEPCCVCKEILSSKFKNIKSLEYTV